MSYSKEDFNEMKDFHSTLDKIRSIEMPPAIDNAGRVLWHDDEILKKYGIGDPKIDKLIVSVYNDASRAGAEWVEVRMKKIRG